MLIDALTYTYERGSSNRLQLVTDGTGNGTGFDNGSSGTGTDYSYDGAGNLLTDNNRGATLSYNCLNLPRRIGQGGQTLDYVYDASGQKLSVSVGGVTTYYQGGFEYDGSMNLVRLSTGEGQLVKQNNAWQWQYYLSDGQGNVRVVVQEGGNTLHENQYYPFGLIYTPSVGMGVQQGNRYQFLGKETQPQTGYVDLQARQYDPQIGRFVTVDPVTDSQEEWSVYQYGWDDPINRSDPDGKCPNCVTGAIGAGVGAVVGGAIEAGIQLYNHGEIKDWKAVGGAALQGGITGAAAGFTGGASLLVTTGVSVGANAVGGAANRALQGKATTTANILGDAAVGAGGAVLGHVAGKTTERALNNLSQHAKGKLGEFITEAKYLAKGYISEGKAAVATGGRTATGRVQRALFDHNMKNVFTGQRLTVESKFNGARPTLNQRIAAPRVVTPGGLIIDRTTSSQLGNAASTTIRGASGQIKRQD